MTHDPYAALIIDHDLLNGQAAKQSALDSSSRAQAWTDIPFPTGTAPSILPDSPTASLPAADVVLITYTTDEANAMAAVLTPGFLAIPPKKSTVPAWTSYTHEYASYVPDLLRGSSPALDSHNLGLYKLVQLAAKRVLCFKSSLHLARDGKSIPIMRLVQQIHSEPGAGLIITTGTAGGIGASVQLGDAAITNTCRFDLVRMFASEPFNGSGVTRTFQLKDPSYLGIANHKLIGVNANRLSSAPIPPKRTPTIASGTAVFGGDPLRPADAGRRLEARIERHLSGLWVLHVVLECVGLLGLRVGIVKRLKAHSKVARNGPPNVRVDRKNPAEAPSH
jgi:hypothetical protein